MTTIQTKTVYQCDICHETSDDYFAREIVNGREYHYCRDCFNSHAEQCEQCDDYFIHIGEHNRDSSSVRFA